MGNGKSLFGILAVPGNSDGERRIAMGYLSFKKSKIETVVSS
ncbi:hypothetical protein OU5_P0306 (plasmid) [Pseudomonas mandelii JR-1]|jgi:hypothetical protein|uniref:Uncharacterized protein n=1 Tax=Pseudomonas mandelii JR-1 TaxID=1147786 RepID=A0A024EME6_9PSED|nr:hypothetical protein OU5_P0306 [Pseudomonas mandelii JR-1]